MHVERVDFVSFFTQDIARANLLHCRFAPFPDGRFP